MNLSSNEALAVPASWPFTKQQVAKIVAERSDFISLANVKGLAPATESAPPILVEVSRYPQEPTRNG